MNKPSKKQIILGITGLLLSVGLFILSFSLFDMNKWMEYIIIAISGGGFLGSILYIYGGAKFCLIGSLSIIGTIIFTILVKELPEYLTGIFIIIVIFSFIALPFIKNYIFDREKNSETPIIKSVAEKIKRDEKAEQDLETENEQFKKSIAFGESSLILQTLFGNYYQCIKGRDDYYLIYIGNELVLNTKSEFIRTDFSDESEFLKRKKDYTICKRSISSITYKINNLEELKYSGILKIDYNGTKKRFNVLEIISKECIENFFIDSGTELIIEASKENIKENKDTEDDTITNQEVLKKLKLFCVILTLISVLLSAMFVFLIINYKVLSIICMVIPIIFLVLSIKFKDYFTLSDNNNLPTFSKHRINIFFSLGISCIGLLMRSVMDFDFISYGKLIILSISLIAILLFVFFRLTTEYKKNKSVIFVISVIMLMYAPSAVIQINYIFDNSEPVIVQSEIIELNIFESSDGPTTYLVRINLSNGREKEIKVSQEFYNTLDIGETVTIGEFKGFLNIPYAVIKED